MTGEQQHLFNFLKNIAWDENQLKRELESGRYQIFLDTKSLGQFLIEKYHRHDPLPKWAESFFDWNNYIRYGGVHNVFRLPDDRYVHILI